MTNLLIAIMNMSKFEIAEMEEVARKLGHFDYQKIKKVVKILKKYRHSLRKCSRSAQLVANEGEEVEEEEEVEETTFSSDALFYLFDADKSGLIDFSEFTELW